MALASNTSISSFDPNGKDSTDGKLAEDRYKRSRLAMNDTLPPGTYYEFQDAKEDDDYNGVDWWQLYYVDYKLVEKAVVQVKAKANDDICVVEIRRGNENEGWAQKVLKRAPIVYLAEQKRKANKFRVMRMNIVVQKVTDLFGQEVMSDLPTLKQRFADRWTEDTDVARWGALGTGGFEPVLHFKSTTYQNRPAEDVLVYVPDRVIGSNEFELIDIVPDNV